MRKLLAAAVFSSWAGVALAAPRIDSISPSQGPIAGGTVVTISGSGFTGASVALDQNPIAPASITDSQIQLTVPPHDNGYALIEVKSGTDSAAVEFLYVPPKLQDLPPGFITTVAGVGLRVGFHRPATQADIQPWGLAADAAGNVDVVSAWFKRVFRVTAAGMLEPFIGDGTAQWDPTDGLPATLAHISFPRSVGLDSAGNAFVSDAYHTIKRVDANTGIITTICGTPRTPGFSGDGGPAKDALIHDPNFLAVAPDGTVYFLDFSNARIRRITPAGVISTIAGTGVSGSDGDGGSALAARIDVSIDADSDAIAFDPRGFLYFGETATGRVRRIDLSTGIITTIHAFPDDSADGRHWPWIRALAVDPSGNVYAGLFTEIFKLSPAGEVLASWGKHKVERFSADGTLLSDLVVGEGLGLAVDRDGNLLYTDGLIGRVRRLNFATGRVEPVAGSSPDVFGVPGPAIGAVLPTDMGDLAFLPGGDLLFGSQQLLRLFRIDRTGAISIEAGTGSFLGGNPDGHPVLTANIGGVAALEVDPAGGYFWANSGPIIYVDPSGIGHRVAGNSGQAGSGFAGDGGPAKDALLDEPWDIVRDAGGNLFIADTNNNRIRRIDAATGIITTVVGNGGPVSGWEGYGKGSFCGDGGSAIDACLNTPYAVAVDPSGGLFVSDYENRRIRRVDAAGTISTFAEIQATKLVADANGVLFTNGGNTVDRYRPDGHRSSAAGQEVAHGFSGDGGPARSALVSTGGIADGLAIDSEGNLFFYDMNNFRIRAVRSGAVLAPPGARVEISTGASQSAALNHAFLVPLEVVVRGEDGIVEPSVRVDFSAPPSGATCVFSNGITSISVLTDRDGKASAVCRANCFSGSYTVTATPLASGKSVSFSLKNLAASEVHALPQDSDLQSRGESPGPCGLIAPVPAPVPAPIEGRP